MSRPPRAIPIRHRRGLFVTVENTDRLPKDSSGMPFVEAINGLAVMTYKAPLQTALTDRREKRARRLRMVREACRDL